MNIDCGWVMERVDDLIDDRLTADEQRLLRAHLAACPACDRTVGRALDLQARLAALPAAVAPARDLWPGIARRIGAARPRVRNGWTWFAGVAAGGGAIALATLLALQQFPRLDERPGTVTGMSGVVVPVDPGLQFATHSMLDAAEDGTVDALPPDAVAIVRENLALVERALDETAAALEQEPDNPHLQRQLLDIYQGQVRLLDYLARAGARPHTRIDL